MLSQVSRVNLGCKPLDLVNYPLFSDRGFEKTMGFQQATKSEISELADATVV